MALPASPNALSASAINTELNRTSNLTISLASAATGGYATINTSSSLKPNASTPHAMSEWHGYNHTATAVTFASCSISDSFQPGDGGGYIEITYTISNAAGGEYITIEGNVSGGDPITSTGSFGPSSAFTSSPAQYNIALGASASGSVTVKLYSSGNALLDTESFSDAPFPI